MESLPVSIWALAFAVLCNCVLWFFKTPKESQTELAGRVDDLEDNHHALDKNVWALTAEVRHLTGSINRLSNLIDSNGSRISGEHRQIDR